jgi:hypothetical protein
MRTIVATLVIFFAHTVSKYSGYPMNGWIVFCLIIGIALCIVKDVACIDSTHDGK